MATMPPQFSIILPTFNRRAYLEKTIESVLMQSFQNWELIIADDGSDEQTQSFIRSLSDSRIRVLWLKHCGNPGKVRNEAIRTASGRYLAFIDSDDIWAVTKLEEQLRALNDHPNCRWSYTHCDRITASGDPLDNGLLKNKRVYSGWIVDQLVRLEAWISMPSVVAERDLVEKIGGFDEEQRFEEQLEFCVQLALRSEVIALQEPLCSIRAHEEHYSGDRIAAISSWDRLYTKISIMVPEGPLRNYCKLARSQSALRLARMQLASGRRRDAVRTMVKSAKVSWRFPSWWLGVARIGPRVVLGR